jgi:hypothetical protein
MRAPYWRISLNAAQQQVLEELSNATAGRALVCYATPAFDRLSQLYAHTISGTIVANSSFPRAADLSGHTAWNYNQPGAVGVANAMPERIDGPGLEGQIASLLLEHSNAPDNGYEANLKRLLDAVMRVIDESAMKESRAAFFYQRTAEVDSLLESLDLPKYREGIRSYLKVLAFTSTYNMRWYVLGRAEHA